MKHTFLDIKRVKQRRYFKLVRPIIGPTEYMTR